MIFDKVKAIIAENLKVEASKITQDAGLKELGADSLDIVEIILAIEEEFGIEVEDGDALNIKTIADAVKYIESKIK